MNPERAERLKDLEAQLATITEQINDIQAFQSSLVESGVLTPGSDVPEDWLRRLRDVAARSEIKTVEEARELTVLEIALETNTTLGIPLAESWAALETPLTHLISAIYQRDGDRPTDDSVSAVRAYTYKKVETGTPFLEALFEAYERRRALVSVVETDLSYTVGRDGVVDVITPSDVRSETPSPRSDQVRPVDR